MAGSIGGMLIASTVGLILQYTNNSYYSVFIIAGSAYLIALFVMHLLVSKLEPVNLGEF